jgi:NTP pyrophosphatase (non-canonical NTP hydrolase)
MNFSEYQVQAMRTAGDTIGDQVHGLVVAALGLSGEALELERAIVFQGPAEEMKELGDCFWYLARGATALKLDLADVCSGPELSGPERFRTRREFAIDLIKIGVQFGESVKKIYAQGHEIDVSTLQDLLSDYYRTMQRIISIGQLMTCDEILEANISKLLKRFPAGFTVEASVGRIEDDG